MDPVRVLLIEDDAVDAELVGRVLTSSKDPVFEVTQTESLASARQIVAGADPDAVLLDLSLPDATGVDTVRATIQLAPNVPIVVLTGLDDEHIASEALKCGAQDYLVKGGENNALARSIRYAMDRKQSDRERYRMEERLSNVQKLESLGLLAGGIAHDFNNLLTGVIGHASLCLLKVPRGSLLEESLQQIERTAVRASELCKQLLAYSGKGRFVVSPVNLSEIVEEMVHMLELSISTKAVLRCDLDADVPLFDAAAPQVRQVIMNLITNASDALLDRSGSITLRTGALSCDASYLSSPYLLDPLPEGPYVFVEVSDTGVGMDDEVLKNLFDPFFSTKGHGRGLGLAAILGIVRSHAGTIKVYSEPGKGSTFKVLFPADGSLPRGAPIPQPRGGVSLRGTVLVVDDETAVRNVARVVLTDLGFRVIEAEDGLQAVSELRDRGDAIDIVLLDMTMPRQGGEETFRELRRLRPDVRVILSSGYNEQDAIASFAGKGLAGFLQKPYTAHALIDAVSLALEAAPGADAVDPAGGPTAGEASVE